MKQRKTVSSQAMRGLVLKKKRRSMQRAIKPQFSVDSAGTTQISRKIHCSLSASVVVVSATSTSTV